MIVPITDAFNLTYVSTNCRRRKTLEHGLYAKSNIRRKASKLRHSLKVESIVILSVHLLLIDITLLADHYSVIKQTKAKRSRREREEKAQLLDNEKS